MTLADELALLAHADDGKALLAQPALDYGLGGALLVELALAGRIDVVDKKVVVTDAAPLGRPALDQALVDIAGKARKPKDWVTRLGKGRTRQVLDGLADAGVLRREQDKVLGMFPRTRYPAPGGVEPAAETDARQRLTRAVTTEEPVDERTAALCSLVKAVGLDKKVFKDLPRAQVKARLKTITEGAWAAAAIRKAIDEVHAAIVMAVVLPAAAAGSS